MRIPSNMLMRYVFCKRKGETKGAGKWYVRAFHPRKLTFNQFIDHVTEHNSLYDRSVCQGVMYKMVDCLVEMLLQGNKVELGDLGTFYCSIHTTGAESLVDYNVREHLKGLSINFRPSGKQDSNLSSVNLAGKVKFRELTSYNDER